MHGNSQLFNTDAFSIKMSNLSIGLITQEILSKLKSFLRVIPKTRNIFFFLLQIHVLYNIFLHYYYFLLVKKYHKSAKRREKSVDNIRYIKYIVTIWDLIFLNSAVVHNFLFFFQAITLDVNETLDITMHFMFFDIIHLRF